MFNDPVRLDLQEDGTLMGRIELREIPGKKPFADLKFRRAKLHIAEPGTEWRVPFTEPPAGDGVYHIERLADRWKVKDVTLRMQQKIGAQGVWQFLVAWTPADANQQAEAQLADLKRRRNFIEDWIDRAAEAFSQEKAEAAFNAIYNHAFSSEAAGPRIKPFLDRVQSFIDELARADVMNVPTIRPYPRQKTVMVPVETMWPREHPKKVINQKINEEYLDEVRKWAKAELNTKLQRAVDDELDSIDAQIKTIEKTGAAVEDYEDRVKENLKQIKAVSAVLSATVDGKEVPEAVIIGEFD
jgi:hypothetical protein